MDYQFLLRTLRWADWGFVRMLRGASKSSVLPQHNGNGESGSHLRLLDTKSLRQLLQWFLQCSLLRTLRVLGFSRRLVCYMRAHQRMGLLEGTPVLTTTKKGVWLVTYGLQWEM